MIDTRESTREFPRLAVGIEFGPEETAGGTLIAFLPPDRFLEISSETARILRLVDGKRDIPTLASLASAALSMEVSPGAFQTLLDQSLVPCGLVRYDGDSPTIPRPQGRDRMELIPARGVAVIARALGFLYRPAVAGIAIAMSLGAQLWFFLGDSVTPSEIGTSVAWGWLATGILYLMSMLAHEIGHATALRAFGVVPGAIGPSAARGVSRWSSDVTGIWKLPRRQRIVVDLGGIYLQALFVGALILIGASLPGLVPGLAVARAVVIVDVVIIGCLGPHWRADGYWLAADLAGARYERAGVSAPSARGSLRSHRGARVPGVYGLVYATVALACLAGLWIWVAGHPGFDTRFAFTRPLDGPSLISSMLSVVLKALVLAGLAHALWTGIEWIMGMASPSGRPRPQTKPGGGS